MMLIADSIVTLSPAKWLFCTCRVYASKVAHTMKARADVSWNPTYIVFQNVRHRNSVGDNTLNNFLGVIFDNFIETN